MTATEPIRPPGIIERIKRLVSAAQDFLSANRTIIAVLAIGCLAGVLVLSMIGPWVTIDVWWLVGLLVGFVLSTLAWLLVSATNAQEPEPRVRVVSWLLLVGGVALVGLFLLFRWDGLGIVGAVCAYLGLGQLLVLWRGSTRARLWRGPLLLAVCTALLVVGWTTLSRGGLSMPSLVAVAVAVLLAPVAVALTSEDVLLRRATRGRTLMRLVAVAAGLALAGVAAVLLGFTSGQPAYGLGLFATAAFLGVGAVVANSRLDSLLVVAGLVALLSLVPDSAPSPPDPDGDAVVVALGDSYMSGEGAEAFYEGTDNADVNECRRSPTAWVNLLDARSDTYGGLASFACSGATTNHLYRRAQYPGEPIGNDGDPMTQLEQLEALLDNGTDVEVIFVSIGGNDAGFATFGITCALPGDCAEFEAREGQWLKNTKNVRAGLSNAYAALNDVLDDAGASVPVVVVPYPDPLTDETCSEVALNQHEVDFVHTFLDRLNTVVEQEGTQAGFLYADAIPGSLTHERARLCESGGAVGIHFVGLQSMNGSPEQQVNPANWAHGSLHPNEVGHEAIHKAMLDWLEANEPLTPGEPQRSVIDDDVDVQPPCTLYDVNGSSCTDRARNWAVEQVQGLWAPEGLLLLVGLGGAWLFWIALIAQWRSSRRPQAQN